MELITLKHLHDINAPFTCMIFNLEIAFSLKDVEKLYIKFVSSFMKLSVVEQTVQTDGFLNEFAISIYKAKFTWYLIKCGKKKKQFSS